MIRQALIRWAMVHWAWAARQGGRRLPDQLSKDLDGRLLARDHADALPGHHRTMLDVALDDRPFERAGPKMLDLELCVLLADLAPCVPLDEFALHLVEALGRLIAERPDGDHRKPRIELDRRYRIARAGADERLLQPRMGD